MKLTDKKILIAGAGVSGIGAAKLLGKKNIASAIYDANTAISEETIRTKAGNPKDLAFETGEYRDELADRYDMLVLSPGIPLTSPIAKSFSDRGKPIWGEIELADYFAQGRIAAITGTNGKTTTTALVGKILESYYDSTFVVGNIGIPFTSVAAETTVDSVIAAEISSFQLETIHQFRPAVSAVLNVTPDHLDRHGTMEAYARTKFSISRNQTKEEVMILNYDDPVTAEMGERTTAKPVYFSRVRELSEGIFLKDGCFLIREGGRNIPVCTTDEIRLLGDHNQENILAAIGISYYMGVPVPKIRDAVREFNAVEHRIEYVRTAGGVDYYNDSKGTNPDAAIKGISAMVKPTVLIGGGYDKQAEYGEWIDSFDGKVKTLVLVGQTADAIEKTAVEHNFTDIIKVSGFEEAVLAARDAAKPGDAVLLSPACASWGMFKNYEERGRVFKEIVRSFKE